MQNRKMSAVSALSFLIAFGNCFFHAEAQRTQSKSNKIFDFIYLESKFSFYEKVFLSQKCQSGNCWQNLKAKSLLIKTLQF